MPPSALQLHTKKSHRKRAVYLPVSAAPMTSPPPRMRGMASAWMGVGSSHPMASTARINSGCTGARHATVDCTRRALYSGSAHLQTELLVRAHIVQQHKLSGSPRYTDCVISTAGCAPPPTTPPFPVHLRWQHAAGGGGGAGGREGGWG
jgi:hypothetical protein